MKILLSIKPEYANSIFAGKKRFEFRKALFKNTGVKTVVVYATKPVGKVIGEFSISAVHTEAPSDLWKRTSKESGITRSFFDSYFKGRETAHAIEVGTLKKYRRALDLNEVIPSGCAPQSFTYL